MKQYRLLSAALCVAVLSAAAPAVFAQDNTDAAAMEKATTDPAAFVKVVASSNMFEIESSNLALEKSQNDQIRSFAQKMIDDHTSAGEKMKSIAQEAGVEVPAEMGETDMKQLNDLQAASDFDQAYVAAQVAAHEKAVTLFDGFANKSGEGALRDFAAETLPTLKDHQEMARQLPGA
jgi:putative membrane protein